MNSIIMTQPIDQSARDEAIRTDQSFIVQAPAGSGKTELLTQRYLALLACIQRPEEIVALTFTKQAAAEMKERILKALLRATDPTPPDSAHEQKTYRLACQALKQDQTQQWQLLKNPNRMQIQTLDSLAAAISKERPLLTEGVSQFEINSDCSELYEQAAKNVIAYIHDPESTWFQSIQTIIHHLDVNLFKLERLFISILSRREQWLPYLLHPELNELNQNALDNIAQQLFNKIKLLSPELLADWYEVASYAQQNLKASNLIERHALFTQAGLNTWKQMIALVLKSDFGFRKTLTVKNGFPAASQFKDKQEKSFHKQKKDLALQLIYQLSEDESLQKTLKELCLLPEITDLENNQILIQALQQVLPVLTAELKHLFFQKQYIDFNELSTLAIQTLDDPDVHSDTKLKLDRKINHILVDEFQDTSVIQYKLLCLLISEWQIEEQRTIFFVGDPMQSIYRFRQAEVGLFLNVQKGQIAHLPVKPLYLKSNFRSSPEIIHWLNQSFQYIFPVQPIPHLGAVSYNHSKAERNYQGHIHSAFFSDLESEAEYLCDAIEQHSEQSIAILVRSRSHLMDLTQTLYHKRIDYNAMELDTLIEDPFCLDLISLTRALCHLDDKLAWLSLLRSPLCGLTLNSLYQLAQNEQTQFYQHIQEIKLSESIEQQRLESFLNLMQKSIQLIKKLPLAEVISITIKKYQIVFPLSAQQNLVLEQFLNALEQFDETYYLHDFTKFYKQLSQIRINRISGNQSKLELMTIHKSKGLEFDIVFLPQLQRSPNTSNSQILLWSEFSDDMGNYSFLLAPIKSHSKDKESVFDYLSHLNKSKDQYEVQRLLYVACSRAKKQLYLTATVDLDESDNPKAPSKNSLLSLLWQIKPLSSTQLQQSAQQTDYEEKQPISLERIYIDDYLSIDKNNDQQNHDLLSPSNPLSLNFSSWHTQIGSVVHLILSELLINSTYEEISSKKITHLLEQHQITSKDHEKSIQVIQQVYLNLKNKNGLWLLSDKHLKKQSELELAIINEKLEKRFIDFTFLDQENTRWIIDHKLVFKKDFSAKALVQKYQAQLNQYSEYLKQVEDNAHRLALYLPLQGDLIEL